MSWRCARGRGRGSEATKLWTVGAPQRVDYRLLGPIEIAVDGVRRPVSGHRQELLMAAVVLADGHDVPTDELVQLLWDGAVPRHPEAALRSQVARLRRLIGPDGERLVFGGRGYALSRCRGSADVDRFLELADVAHRADDDAALDAADAALRLWRVPDLVFAERGVLQPTGTRLIERRMAVVERRAELLIRRGRASEVVAELRALVLERPEHEGMRALLMEALHQSDRPTEALALLAEWRHALRQRGLEPTSRLRELERRILRCDRSMAAAARPSTALATATTSLAPPTSFVGRRDGVDRLHATLLARRLVTLVGPGGVGKTRLAREVIRRVGDDAGTVFDVDLGAIDDGADVVQLVGTAVGVEDAADRRLLARVGDRLAAQSCVLLLDNCEHVVEHVAELVAALGQRAPGAKVLATSQRRLGVVDECVWKVEPLSTAGPDAPAVRLFLDRALVASPQLALAAHDIARVERICSALDGLPLALEIAAAQVAGLSLADLELELDHRLELRAPCVTPARHRSLRAVIEWTCHRLDERERRVLEQLCVFVGPFDLSAARAVLRDVIPAREVAACVVQLVERSLLVFHVVDEHGQYRTLQSVRAYGLDRLRGAGVLPDAQAVHARWAVEVAEDAEASLAEAEGATVKRLERCFDDLRAACHWLVATDDGHVAIRLIHALHPYAFWHGRTEVFHWAEAVAALDCASPLRASIHASVCAGAWIRGDLPGAELAAQLAMASVAEPASPLDRRAVEQAAEVALQRGDAGRAVDMYDQAHQLSRVVDDRMQATWDLGSSALILCYTGDVAAAERRAEATTAEADGLASPSARAFAQFVKGELDAVRSPAHARDHLNEAVELARSVGNEFIAGLARVTLAGLPPEGGDDVRAAVRHYLAAVAGWAEIGAWFAQLVTLRNVAVLLASHGAGEEAAVLYGAVTSGSLSSAPLYGADLTKLEQVRATLDLALGEHRVANLASVGQRLAPSEVTALALRALENLSVVHGVDEPA
jgi:predicted ATPase/DNA-binding SARP family transcriptional activator